MNQNSQLMGIPRSESNYDQIALAAVSRVIDGQKSPELCQSVNVTGTENILTTARSGSTVPWILYASSREVYGEPTMEPVTESAERRPLNIYGRSKCEAEDLVSAATQFFPTGILRFSNVYGDTGRDHADRVIPAFAGCAARGGTITVNGGDVSLDFTHIDDVVDGIVRAVHQLERDRASFSPIHLVSGEAITLGSLARLAVDLARAPVAIREAPSRNFDVSHFRGSFARAHAVLGWKPTTFIHAGFSQLIDDTHRTGHPANQMDQNGISSSRSTL